MIWLFQIKHIILTETLLHGQREVEFKMREVKVEGKKGNFHFCVTLLFFYCVLNTINAYLIKNKPVLC